jgi:hypothetical protein
MGQSSRDDRALYIYRWRIGGGGEFLRWEIATGQETLLEKYVPESFIWVSLNERWLIRAVKQNVEIRPTSGGDWKSLVSRSLREWDHEASITPDGKWLLYYDADSSGKRPLFRVATAGGAPERLGDFPTNTTSDMEISPDGTKIVAAAADDATGYELWSLENFVPPAPKP